VYCAALCGIGCQTIACICLIGCNRPVPRHATQLQQSTPCLAQPAGCVLGSALWHGAVLQLCQCHVRAVAVCSHHMAPAVTPDAQLEVMCSPGCWVQLQLQLPLFSDCCMSKTTVQKPEVQTCRCATCGLR
jgi:hypothetical protein